MSSEEKHTEVKHSRVQYPLSEYTFPQDQEARMQEVHVECKAMRVTLIDGRQLSVPLSWIPTLDHAAPEERERYKRKPQRTTMIWDPEAWAINDEVRIAMIEPLATRHLLDKLNRSVR